ncbi:MAG: hypothetical protein ACM3NW_11145 [Syntrophomonadaceae bacterium]
MNSRRLSARLPLAAGLILLLAAPLSAVRRTEEPLALVPADAATVAVIHWNELRASPFGAEVLDRMDGVSTDGDGSRFLRETGLSPREDIDTIVLATSKRAGASDEALVVFEGRFDVARIAAALRSRGATLQKGASGEYYRLPAEHGRNEGAAALVNPGLLIAGSETAVVAALRRRESGGSGGLMSGQGLGGQLSRVDRDASAWALVDLTRYPVTQKREMHVDVQVEGKDEPSRAIVGAMKSMSLLALQAKVKGDAIDVAATGLSSDAENRALLQDSLRGLLAMWRLAVQEKSPEMVSVIRGFQVDSDADGVSIRGTLPGSVLRSLAAHRQGKREPQAP